jgi:hypothetical protein
MSQRVSAVEAAVPAATTTISQATRLPLQIRLPSAIEPASLSRQLCSAADLDYPRVRRRLLYTTLIIASDASVRAEMGVSVAEVTSILRRYRGIHVALDLRTTQGPVVNPYFIYLPQKILTIESVPTDLQRIRRYRDWTRLGPTAHLHPVDI